MDELRLKQPIVQATYVFLKSLYRLKLSDALYASLWNVYPSMDFVIRNHHA